MLATFRLPTSSLPARVWFFGSGIAMALVGALNLLHRSYGRSAFGLRLVCRGANVLLTLFAAVAAAATKASLPECVLILGILGSTLILSFTRKLAAPNPP